MQTSSIYSNTFTYELIMRLLYGRYYAARYRVIANLVPNHASVVDVCCGPGTLFSLHLARKEVRYTGLDLNPKYVERVSRQGGNGVLWDLRSDKPLPGADFLIMQASLYHFLPDAGAVVERMLEAARVGVIIAEPIRNMASSQIRLIALAARYLTDPGSGAQPLRFTEDSLDRFFERYRERTSQAFLIPGGREKVYVLHALGGMSAQ